MGCIVGLFGGRRILGKEGAKGDDHGGINGDGLKEDCANYLLHEVNGRSLRSGMSPPEGETKEGGDRCMRTGWDSLLT